MQPEFYHIVISDEIFNKINNVSFKDNPYIKRENLSYIKCSHYGFDGRIHTGEIIVNAIIADRVTAILEELFRMEYQIEKIRLIDEYGGNDNLSMADNNSSAFNYRNIAGTDRLSNHALGLAIDINPLYNPYLRKGNNEEIICEPSGSEVYVDRSREFAHKIDHNDPAFILFTKYGFEWGGDWHFPKDYQHFEYKP